jgi:hypothetical protein
MSLFTLAAAPCVSGDTLAQYEALGSTGCTFGDFTFSSFSYTSGVGSPAATAVTVATTTNADGTGLAFDASWNALGSGTTSDGDISFSVAVNGATGAESITDAGLAQTGGVGGSGVATVSEQGCGPAPCVPGTWQVLTFDAGTGPGEDESSADTLLAPTGSVEVSKDINADAGTGTSGYDYATISQVTDVFSATAVPEPRALSLLLGLGLVAGFAFRKKLQGARA